MLFCALGLLGLGLVLRLNLGQWLSAEAQAYFSIIHWKQSQIRF
jgi:hypothetical protein